MVPVQAFWHWFETHAAVQYPAAIVASVVPTSQPQSACVVQLFVHTPEYVMHVPFGMP